MLCTLLLAAVPAHAAPLRPVCHGFAAVGELPTEWSCNQTGWVSRGAVGWVRFDAAEWRDGEPPGRVIAPISRFDSATVAVIDATGRVSTRTFGFAQTEALANGPRMALPLPPLPAGTRAVLIGYDGPWSVLTLSGTRLDHGRADPADPWNYGVMILVAMLAGLLCAPVIFDLAFYTALRERFLLWHAVMAAGMLGQVLMATGLGVTLFALSPQALAVLSPLAFAIAVACASFFSASFLEPEALTPRMRGLLRGAGWWTLVGPTVLALQLPGLRELGGQAYNLAFQPAVVIFAVTMVQAVRRGSRAAKFQLAAWTPILLCGTDRLLRGTGVYALPTLADQAIYLAMALEVIITMLGVADRFFILRLERDVARARADRLETLADRDSLTGLLNRRGFDARFAELAEAGYSSIALIDLDHFKTVNDTHGHAIGDQVLRAVARALEPDDDIRAVRMGGEEFLLLMRGADAAARAERRREAIPLRVAADVPGLSSMVTASMGLVEQVPGFAAHHDFALYYAHCDRLLYEAKRNGRNRTASERVQTFAERRRRDRRQRPAGAQAA